MPSVDALVERIGFGRAQFYIACLSPLGVGFMNGSNLVVGSLTATAVGQTFRLNQEEQAVLVTSCLLGRTIGILASGYLGDTLGRRRMVLLSHALIFFCGLCCAASSGIDQLSFFRMCIGLGMGIGGPPAFVAMSENTPARWRILMRGATTMSVEAGGAFIVLFPAMACVPMEALDWRWLSVVACAPSLVWFFLALVFLDESPVFLACTGRREEAELVFKTMSARNQHVNVDVCYSQPDGLAKVLSLHEQWREIYSPRLRFATVLAMLTLLSLNELLYGDMYVVAQVFPEESPLPPTLQIFMKQMSNVGWCLVCTVIADMLSRKWAICFSMAVAVSACYAFALGGSAEVPRGSVLEMFFQSGTLLVGMATSLGQIALMQFSAEIYPPQAASAGSAAIIGVGSFGCVSAPLFFEVLRTLSSSWCLFHLTVGTCCAACFVAVSLAQPVKPHQIVSKVCDEVESNRQMIAQDSDGAWEAF